MKNYQRTIIACFSGYIVQAIINNFAPLLFLTFQTQYQIPLSQITLLVTFNFLTQLGVDFAAIFLSIGLVIVSRLSRRIFCGCRIDWVGCFSTYLSDPFYRFIDGSLPLCNWWRTSGSISEPNRRSLSNPE
ncbi:hypothetical protein ODV97_06480 [Enterococcus gallinarum]|nr:hypothetical protein [Enterococcus gallinarum]